MPHIAAPPPFSEEGWLKIIHEAVALDPPWRRQQSPPITQRVTVLHSVTQCYTAFHSVSYNALSGNTLYILKKPPIDITFSQKFLSALFEVNTTCILLFVLNEEVKFAPNMGILSESLYLYLYLQRQLWTVFSSMKKPSPPLRMGDLEWVTLLYLYLQIQLWTVFVPIEARPRAWESWVSLGAKTGWVSTYPQCADSCKHLFAFFSFQMFHF